MMCSAKPIWPVFVFLVVAQSAYAVDVECKFRGESKPTVYTDLVFGENISFVGGADDVVSKKEVYWGDDYVTIIVESAGIATLVVIDRVTFNATKRVIRSGVTRGEARGTCKMLGKDKANNDDKLSRD
jgi:hypothetical protein